MPIAMPSSMPVSRQIIARYYLLYYAYYCTYDHECYINKHIVIFSLDHDGLLLDFSPNLGKENLNRIILFSENVSKYVGT